MFQREGPLSAISGHLWWLLIAAGARLEPAADLWWSWKEPAAFLGPTDAVALGTLTDTQTLPTTSTPHVSPLLLPPRSN